MPVTTTTQRQLLSADQIRILEYQTEYTDEILRIIDRTKDEVFALLDKWNGKTYNKRFLTALQKIDENYRVESAYSFEISISMWNKRNTPSIEKEYLTLYVDFDTYQLSYTTRSYTESSITIKADEIKQQINNRLEYIEKSNQKLKDDLNNLQGIFEQYTYIQNQISNFVKDTHVLLRHKIGDFKNY